MSDREVVTGVLDNDTAADESDIGPVWGEVDNEPDTETDGEPRADVSSGNATSGRSDMSRVLT